MALIQVVDDIEDNRRLLEFDLEDEGHEVIGASSGPEALALLEQRIPDLILLDLNMPGMSGLEVLTELKNHQEWQGIPVIMVTASDLDDELVKALDKGADDFVSKPYSYPVLAARMRTSLRLKQSQDELRALNQRLQVLATTDPLTGLYNRRHFFDLAGSEFARAVRYGRKIVVAMIDVDHFKAINDKHGHDAGDVVLRELAELFTQCFRQSDIVARMGGEEFAVCMPETSLKEACLPAERFRKVVEAHSFQVEKNGRTVNLSVTLSIGVSENVAIDMEINTAIQRADLALYQAKNQGRNRLVTG